MHDLIKQKEYFEEHLPFTYEERAHNLKKLYQVIEKASLSGEIEGALKKDLGRSSIESYLFEISFILKEISHTLKNLKKWMREKKVSSPLVHFPSKAMISRRPLGVVLIIAPWNYPFQLAMAPLIGALAAGNCVVLRPSELAPATSDLVTRMIRENFDPRLIEVAPGPVEIAKHLLTLDFDFIFYTGSTAVGREIYKAAAEKLIPVVLELGGKSPCFVDNLPSKNHLQVAARRIIWGKFVNAGQTCIAPDYVLVDEKIKDDLVKELIFAIKSFYGKDPESIYKSPDYGRIISHRHFQRLKNMISGKILYGGEFREEEKFIAPTLIDISLERGGRDHPAMKDEIFGPILPILSYKNLNEAILFVKRGETPLANYIFSESKDYTESILNKISFGGGTLNDTLLHVSVPDLPFGGLRQSGLGSYHGEKSFQIFSHEQSILKRYFCFDLSLRYPPYFRRKERLLKFLTK